MSLATWFSFLLACILLITPPGPTVTYLITTSMSHGKKAAYGVVWGSFWGGLVCMVLSFIGIGATLQTSETLYLILRLLGIAYLVYLGIKSLFEANKTSRASLTETPITRKEGFRNGFLLIFLNPKNIIFFTSFFPQFITSKSTFFMQILVLSTTYLIVGLINDFLYSFFASHIGKLLGQHSEKWIHRIGGIAMIVTAILVLFQNL